uniref:Uncharacterized protein n=1 Tax=Anopheles epiroticus TaxID=199890 RepID=A0A182PSD5_9DIPT
MSLMQAMMIAARKVVALKEAAEVVEQYQGYQGNQDSVLFGGGGVSGGGGSSTPSDTTKYNQEF